MLLLNSVFKYEIKLWVGSSSTHIIMSELIFPHTTSLGDRRVGSSLGEWLDHRIIGNWLLYFWETIGIRKEAF
jgi:hypothetical protein